MNFPYYFMLIIQYINSFLSSVILKFSKYALDDFIIGDNDNIEYVGASSKTLFPAGGDDSHGTMPVFQKYCWVCIFSCMFSRVQF